MQNALCRRGGVLLVVMGLLAVYAATAGAAPHSPHMASSTAYRFPAEWERQRSVWMTWQEAPAQYGVPMPQSQDVSARVIKALAPHVRVDLMTADAAGRARAVRYLSRYGVDASRITFHLASRRWFWLRDPGPFFLKRTDGTLMVADFGWNMYGTDLAMPPLRQTQASGAVDVEIARTLGVPIVSSRAVVEGGGFESNGDGVLMGIAATARQRNPGMSLPAIEREYLRLTGAHRMIWLKRSPLTDFWVAKPLVGNYFTRGANGHIDELARFVDSHTILLADIPAAEQNANALSRIDSRILEENYRILKAATDAHGRHFRVIRVPNPDLRLLWAKHVLRGGRDDAGYMAAGFKKGDTVIDVPASSYMNFFVSNGVVLVPRYWHAGMPTAQRDRDASVAALFRRLFPTRQVVQIDPISINWFGGGMHCITQQQPA
jgi:agmatine deiminase